MTGRARHEPLPTLRDLTGMLRSLNAESDGPHSVVLGYAFVDCIHARWWTLVADVEFFDGRQIEHLPGDGQKYDAVAGARRLLADARARGHA